MSKCYDESIIPNKLKRNFNVYARIQELGLSLGSVDETAVPIEKAGVAAVVFHESGLVYLSGMAGGKLPMNNAVDVIKHGFEGGQHAADVLIHRLHWALSSGGEGDLNDVLYTVKALGMVVSPGGGACSAAPLVTNGFSSRWQSVFGGPLGAYAQNGIDPGGFSGLHARSAIGGIDGPFSIEAEMIVAIPPALAQDIIRNRGWVYTVRSSHKP